MDTGINTNDGLAGYFRSALCGLYRQPNGFLRYPYLAAGEPYDHQLWDWDSFWMCKGGLALFRQMPDEHARFLIYAEGCWTNLIESQADNGKIPILILPDKRDVFGCTTDSTHERNQAKPVLCQFALELAQGKNDFQWLESYVPRLIRFLDSWWMYYRSPCGLLTWGGDAAIGVDNEPSVYGRPAFSAASVLLNCLYYQDLLAMVRIGRALNREAEVSDLQDRAEEIASSVQRECWDPQDAFFYTADVQCKDARARHIPADIGRGMDMSWQTLPLKIKSFTGFLPMWCGLATGDQARRMVERHLRNSPDFDAPYGIPTLAKCEKMYAPGINSSNPSNWLGPIWIIANYLVYAGLRNFGFHEEAGRLASKTRCLLQQDLMATGTLHEHYHPDTGAPNFNAGFIDWNILAHLMDTSSRPISTEKETTYE